MDSGSNTTPTADRHGRPSEPLLPSSSPVQHGLLSPTRSTSRRKERRPPSVTPKRFGRFFTPRSSQSIVGRRILARIPSEELNAHHAMSPDSIPSDPLQPSDGCHQDQSFLSSPSQAATCRKRTTSSLEQPTIQRRRVAFDDMPPPQLNLSGEHSQDVLSDWRKTTLNRFFRTSRGQDVSAKDSLIPDAVHEPAAKRTRTQSPELHTPTPVRKFRNRGCEAQLLDREHGFSSHTGRQYMAFPACDARALTGNFYSNSDDHEYAANYEGPGNTTPFCQANLHKSPITAVGDEQGYVRLLRTDGWTNSSSGKMDSFFKAHDNAVIDMDVSSDDMRLATACGDWSGRIFDTTTQSAAVDLRGHTSGMRQVLFQPGRANGEVLATAAKDGCVNIWDLRCNSLPVNAFSTMCDDDSTKAITRRNTDLETLQLRPINSMDLAHVRTANGLHTPASITTLQWFPAGREHLLVSGSEANAAIKLWDIRCIKPRHKDQATPLSVTAEPQHHTFRSYGLTSLAINADGSRLYSVCKDNTVYAYSTAHLILGQAPELVNSAVKRKPRGLQGIGPLYGWKNDRLSAISFWVKASLRAASASWGPELLAVGGNDKCPIVFPTDERYMRSAFDQRNHILETSSANSSAATGAARSTLPSLNPSAANIPIFRCGTALVNGHDKEVSAVGWTNQGRLVSLSDDGGVRHWQDDDTQRAGYLRQVGDFGGERWNAGWADVSDGWDDEE
ncbi:WD40 repeat [Geosmithia morbida]|uniref:WD40 repeat n=1 Tax=Geosmithia morbida TaxID=1094350 RepID=A0A9P5D2I8_9HYPO|nr:WD40 repeat [Geosmithia morbida]KAF4120860.1 WD40 repeat [Geosmithia morbida]